MSHSDRAANTWDDDKGKAEYLLSCGLFFIHNDLLLTMLEQMHICIC